MLAPRKAGVIARRSEAREQYELRHEPRSAGRVSKTGSAGTKCLLGNAAMLKPVACVSDLLGLPVTRRDATSRSIATGETDPAAPSRMWRIAASAPRPGSAVRSMRLGSR